MINHINKILQDESANSTSGAIVPFRREIDRIDDAIAELLVRRLSIATVLSSLKSDRGLPVQDPQREVQVLERATSHCEDPHIKQHVGRIFRTIIDECVNAQQRTQRLNTSLKPANTFGRICIIGAGLIGGAMARRIRESAAKSVRITAVDLPDALTSCRKEQIFDEVTDDLGEVTSCDLIVLCAPPRTNTDLLVKIAPVLKPGQVVMDVSSVKSGICEAATQLNLNGAQFVGGHPFFGTEKKGFENSGFVETVNKTFCLVPLETTDPNTLNKVADWLDRLRLRVQIASPEMHDRVVARTSHLVQLLASITGAMIHDDVVALGAEDLLSLSGGGLASITRLMGSPAELWIDIFQNNRAQFDQLLDELELIIHSLKNTKCDADFSEAISKCFAKSQIAQGSIQNSAR